MTKGTLKPDMPVSIGLHNFRIKPGQSIKVDKEGNIFIIGLRGKETDTHKNINSKPVEFKGPPLKGDVQKIREYSKPYHEPKNQDHYMFSIWRGLDALMGNKLKFKKFDNGLYKNLFRAVLGEFQLVAKEKTPTELLYIIDSEGHIYHRTGHTANIPDTLSYVRACEAEARAIDRAREKAEEAAILHREAMRVQLEEDKKNSKRRTRMKPHDPTQVVHISKEQSLRAMGLMPSDETQPPKLSKEEMRKLASSTYLRMKAAKEAG